MIKPSWKEFLRPTWSKLLLLFVLNIAASLLSLQLSFYESKAIQVLYIALAPLELIGFLKVVVNYFITQGLVENPRFLTIYAFFVQLAALAWQYYVAAVIVNLSKRFKAARRDRTL